MARDDASQSRSGRPRAPGSAAYVRFGSCVTSVARVTFEHCQRLSPLVCRTCFPIAASTQAVIVEIFGSPLTGQILGQLSRSGLVAVAYVQSTERPGPRIQVAAFICKSRTTRRWRDIGLERRPRIFMSAVCAGQFRS